jgi:hypothetical protein
MVQSLQDEELQQFRRRPRRHALHLLGLGHDGLHQQGDGELGHGASRAAIIATIVLLAIYALVVLAVESFAGTGSTGIGLGNSNNTNDVLSVLGPAVFGRSGFASVLSTSSS